MPTETEDVWRDLAPHALARLLRTYGRDQFELCEDAVADALLDAHRQWPAEPPDDPRAWLVTVARRRYVDRVRAETRRREREERAALLAQPLADAAPRAGDDALLLLQLCCHPAVSRSGQVALTLRAVCGLTVRQIANAHQLPESTIAQRITRAKKRITQAGKEFPGPVDAAERLGAVLDVLYLMFTEAHHTTTGEPAHDTDLAAEAIRLARLLRSAVPESTEAAGLLALMVLTEARHPARVGPAGELIPLDQQDRGLWDRPLIDEGLAILDAVTPGAVPGGYLVQACIAGLHAHAADTEATDWDEIHALYTVLDHLSGGANPTVRLNRIVAAAMLFGEDAALAQLDELAGEHPDLPRLESVRAHLRERFGDAGGATVAYRRAIAATVNVAEKRYLQQRLQALDRAAAATDDT
ncbi:MAG: sigma factor [Gordonia sp. (in: high G+C Gram-positive bacteria)]